MATFSPYLDISNRPCFMASSLQPNLSNSTAPLILPHRSSDGLEFDGHDFQSNHLDSSLWSSSAAPSLSGLGIRNLDFAKDLKTQGYSQDVPPVPNAHLTFDRQYGGRTPRVEPTYDILNETLDSVMKPPDNPFSIPSTWSFSSVIKAAELAADDAVYEMRSALSLELGLGDLGTASNLLDPENYAPWAFAPSTPRNFVSDFITQLSACDSALKQTAIFSEICLDNASHAAQILAGDGQTQMTYNFQEECSIMSAATDLIPGLSLPVVDINMRNADPCIGVNPADILPALPSPPSLFNVPLYFPCFSDSLSTNQLMVDGDFFRQDNVASMEYSGFQTEVTYQISHDVVLPAPACAGSKASKQASDDEHSVFHSPTSSDYSPPLESPLSKQAFPMKGKKRRIARTKTVEECDYIYQETGDDCQHQAQGLDLPVDLGTPVLDAHRGVELEELKAKAERYRLRNQGRDYDKRWLISFAGKLSMRGELVEEFRCYITGCEQMNKRRDHILIHVGAHLDQRPFKCRHWYVLIIYQHLAILIMFFCSSSRFLRKNECKRHELSHTGIRPYSCHLCPLPATTFVRQDLLKRHMKRTHRLDLEKVDKENSDTYRPKKKARA